MRDVMRFILVWSICHWHRACLLIARSDDHHTILWLIVPGNNRCAVSTRVVKGVITCDVFHWGLLRSVLNLVVVFSWLTNDNTRVYVYNFVLILVIHWNMLFNFGVVHGRTILIQLAIFIMNYTVFSSNHHLIKSNHLLITVWIPWFEFVLLRLSVFMLKLFTLKWKLSLWTLTLYQTGVMVYRCVQRLELLSLFGIRNQTYQILVDWFWLPQKEPLLWVILWIKDLLSVFDHILLNFFLLDKYLWLCKWVKIIRLCHLNHLIGIIHICLQYLNHFYLRAFQHSIVTFQLWPLIILKN